MKNLLKGSVKVITKGIAVGAVGFFVFCWGAAYGINATDSKVAYVKASSDEEA